MIDTHCHLEMYDNLSEIIDHMKDGIMIAAGTDFLSSQKVLEFSCKYSNVYGTIGIHPEEVNHMQLNDLLWIEKHLNDPKIVGIGEIGLDYHYGKENREKQIEIFKKQLLLAKKYRKTVVIHSRDAIEDTYNILKELKMEDTKIIIHCYSSSLEMAKKFLQFKVKFGIGGVITFKNAVKLREVVENIDIQNLLLETDSPFLTPEPYRGERNEPYNIIYVAKKIAQIKGISLKEVLEMTRKNAICQFDLNEKL